MLLNISIMIGTRENDDRQPASKKEGLVSFSYIIYLFIQCQKTKE